MMALTVNEFKFRVSENIKEFNRQGGIYDLTKFYYADGIPGDFDPYTLGSKFQDAYSSVIIGALAFITQKTGADGLALIGCKLVECEFKNCSVTVNERNSFVGPKGGIYSASQEVLTNVAKKIGGILYVNKNDACGITSKFKATFQIYSETHKQTKNRPTFLIVMDAFNKSAIIDCYYLDGDAVIENLRDGSTIALASFINAGEVYKIACGLAEGFNNWCVKISKTLPKGKSVNPNKWKMINFG